jgi:imidazoleglycerol-phosphate dehydratase
VRKAKLHRKTAETEIQIALTIEGRGKYEVSTGIRFLDHMLELFTRHGGFDLKLSARGDLDVDQHHTVEDVGIALGEAFDRALGDRRGILRAGYFLMTMDETLGLAAVDFRRPRGSRGRDQGSSGAGRRSANGTGVRLL